MARSRLDIQKQILEQLNQRVEALVDEILRDAENNKGKVDPSNVRGIEEIINKLERMEFNGNVELLKDTVAVYDKAIKSIDEQLKSEDMKGFDKFSEDSLKDAKKLLEGQSKNGRVGTIFDKLQEISEAEKSGEVEKRYNDDRIEEIDYSIKDQKEEESKRVEPFNKIIAETRKFREELTAIDAIVKEVSDLVKEREALLADLKNPDIGEEDEKSKKEKLKEINKKIVEVSGKAKNDENDKDYELKENEKITDYIARVQGQFSIKTGLIEVELRDALDKIKDLEVDLGPEKKKVEEYLKDCMTDTKKLHNLTDKLSIDKAMLKKYIEKDPKHKEMQELENKKRVYEQRNEEIYKSSEEKMTSNENERGMTKYEEEKFDWRHPFKSLQKIFNKKGKVKNNSNKSNEEISKNKHNSTAVDRLVLQEIEQSVKNMGKDFKDQYKVEEKDKISTEVEFNINTRREKFYADLEKKEAEEKEGR